MSIRYPASKKIVERLIKSIKRWSLFEARDHLLVAVSGGIDSMVLLHLLSRLPLPLRPRITVAHFNHRLRGRDSERDALFVDRISKQWGLACRIGRADRTRPKSNIEAIARRDRYRFLFRTARRLKARKVVTAHQADDQAETFLMRWIQGAGLRGLSGIRMSRREGKVELIRPLLLMTRKEIQEYSRLNQVPYRVDRTNRQDLFLRNRVRKLLKALRKENPNLTERTSLNLLMLQADQDFLEGSVRPFLRNKKTSLTLYRKQSRAIRYRILQGMFRRAVGSEIASLPADRILDIDHLLVSPEGGKQLNLPHRIGLVKGKKAFLISKNPYVTVSS